MSIKMYIPLNPTLIQKKLGFAGVYLMFLSLIQNMQCVPAVYILSENIKKIKICRMIFFSKKSLYVTVTGESNCSSILILYSKHIDKGFSNPKYIHVSAAPLINHKFNKQLPNSCC